MTVTMQQVRATLDQYEPNFATAAQNFGADALPHLEEIIRNGDSGFASRAVYLASLIAHERAGAVVAMGAERPEATMRLAVAAGARNLAARDRDPLLLRLLDSDDVGVRKLALRSVRAQPDALLAGKVERLAGNDPEPALRSLAREVLDQGR